MSAAPLHVLYLCTGNSCRSQMAEGFTRVTGGDRVVASSAGIEAHGKNPRAIAAMAELGIDIGSQESTRVTDAMIDAADLIVTVCGHADEHCPVLPPGKQRLHWPLPDPAKATGTEDQVVRAFREVRDDIHARVRKLLEERVGVDA